jgi:hypothetical protein
MIKRIIAYGDSFTYGYDLSDCKNCPNNLTYAAPSNLTYAALLAQHYGLEYECRAVGSTANQGITRNIINSEILPTDLVMVMWTFIERNDFLFEGDMGWRSISPGDKLPFAQEYYRYIDSNSNYGLYLTHKELLLTETYLKSTHAPFLFLSVVDIIYKSLVWNNRNLLKLIDRSNWIIPFGEQGFWNWAKTQNLLAHGQGHANEQAHRVLADYIISQNLISK